MYSVQEECNWTVPPELCNQVHDSAIATCGFVCLDLPIMMTLLPFISKRKHSRRPPQTPALDPVIPVELLEEIVAFVPVDDKRTLRALSLVSRIFRVPSQRILFSTIELGIRRNANINQLVQELEHCHRLLHKSPHLAPFVVSFDLGGGLASRHNILSGILPKLVNIQNLSIAADIVALPNDTKLKRLIHNRVFPRITSLHAVFPAFDTSSLAGILHASPRLRQLSIQWSGTREFVNHNLSSSQRRSHPLKSLIVGLHISDSTDLLVKALELAGCRDIQSLTFPRHMGPSPLNESRSLLEYTARTLTRLDLRGLARQKLALLLPDGYAGM